MSTAHNCCSYILATLMLLPTLAAAAPAKPDPAAQEPPTAEEEPSDQLLVTTRELFVRGMNMFKAKDYAGAIGPWQQAYEMAPLCHRVELFVPLASAHWYAYQDDGEEEHLRQALAMLTRALEAIGSFDAQTLDDVRDQLIEIEAELERLEQVREQQRIEDAQRKAIAQEQAQRSQEARAQRQAQLEAERRRFGVHVRVGSSVAGVGGVFLATAVVGLGLGEGVDRDGRALATRSNVSPAEVSALFSRGQVYNRLAVATGVIGGAMVVGGGAVLIAAAVRLKRAKAHAKAQARVLPGPLGVEVRF